MSIWRRISVLLFALTILTSGFMAPSTASSGDWKGPPPPGTIDENGVYWGPPVDMNSGEDVTNKYESEADAKKHLKPADAIDVEINEVELNFDVWPYLNRDNRVMIPVRRIAEELQGTVTWDAVTKTVSIHRPAQKFNYGGFKDIERSELTVEFKIGEKSATVNKQTVMLDTQAEIKNGRTLVPLRFVAENFDADVNWRAYDKTVEIDFIPALVTN